MSVQLCIPMNELYFITQRAKLLPKGRKAPGNKLAHSFKGTVGQIRLAQRVPTPTPLPLREGRQVEII
jgi:hypothetical protein